jgi:hypothetical protein
MDFPTLLFGTEVPGGACWHLSVSTKAGTDRELSDAEWAEVAKEAMSRLGFEAAGHQAGCRWVAVRHGRSGAGNDHIHVVVELVREDGKVARTANDFRRLSRLCADMERRYRLSVVEGRTLKAAMPGLTGPRRRKPAAPDGPKRNGPSSPGSCAQRRRSQPAKPNSCGSSETPG